mgnify:FL=1
MNWNEYLSLSEKTLSTEFHANDKVQRVLHGVMGIGTEVGELLEAFNMNETPIDLVNLKEEIGDAYWYLAILYREMPEMAEKRMPGTIDVPIEYILHELSLTSFNLLDLMKKKLFYNKTIDPEQFEAYVNHIDHYLKCLLLNHSFILNEILDTNINKLKARYGDKFSADKAINRDLDTERDILSQ